MKHDELKRLRDDALIYARGITAALSQPATYRGDVAAAQMWMRSLSDRLDELSAVTQNPIVHS